jgi:hypothetical protein
MAANAFAGILGEMVPAHEKSPLGKSSIRLRISPQGTCAPELQVPYQGCFVDPLVSPATIPKKGNDSGANGLRTAASSDMGRGMLRQEYRLFLCGATSVFRRLSIVWVTIIMKKQGKIKFQ